MTNATIEARVRKLLTDPEDNREIVKDIAKLWRENYKATYEQAQKNTLTLATLALTFSLFATASLEETSLFGMKFRNVDTPLLILFAICSYLFYRVVSLFAVAQLVSEAIRETDYQLWRKWQVEGLLDLADYPSVMQVENTLANIDKTGLFRVIANAWGMGTFLLAVFSALWWFYWAGTTLLARASIAQTLSIAVVIVASAFILRALLALIHAGFRAA